MYGFALVFASVLLSPFLFTNQAFATSAQEENISVGHRPLDVTINPNANMIYVTNYEAGSVSVIDGSTNKVVGNITVGVFPSVVAVNSETDMIYVIHRGPPGSMVSVMDGKTNTVINTMELGYDAIGLAVNSNTNKIYVSYWNYSDRYLIYVIDGSVNEIVDTLSFPSRLIAVNPTTNRLYTAIGGQINTIDGETNTLIDTIETGKGNAIDLAVNPNINKIYVLNSYSPTSDTVGLAIPTGSLFVIEGSTNTIVANITLGLAPGGLAVNPNTNNVYASHRDAISVIEGSTDQVINKINIDTVTHKLAFNPNTNKLYMLHSHIDTLSVISDPEPNQSIEKTFAVSSSLDGNNYTITGKSDSVKVLSFKIYPKWGIEIKIERGQGGEVELTLPKNMIDGIQTVDVSVEDYTEAAVFQEISSNSSSTKIKFTVPRNAYEVEIKGITVVPEFPVNLIAITAVGLIVVLLASRSKSNLVLR